MLEGSIIRRLFLAPPALRSSSLLRTARHVQPPHSQKYSTSIQSVIQPSFWSSLVPKPLRRIPSNAKKSKSKDWNPATFFIIIFLLIGSMSIQMIALRSGFATFSRRADAKIDLLREVIERVQRGEEVDVEGLLGTGNPEKEKEWEEVLREIEKEDELCAEPRRKKPRRGVIMIENASTKAEGEARSTTKHEHAERKVVNPKTKPNAPPGFY